LQKCASIVLRHVAGIHRGFEGAAVSVDEIAVLAVVFVGV
jgi:hypothetical protein